MMIQGITTSGKFLGIQWFGVSWDIFSQSHQIRTNYTLTQLRKKHNAWQSFWFLEAAYSIFRSTALTYLFSDKENCQQIQADVQTSLLLGQYDPVSCTTRWTHWYSDLSVVGKNVMWRRVEEQHKALGS